MTRQSIYVLVLVCYDYNRDQRNIMASSDKELLLIYAKTNHRAIPILEYTDHDDFKFEACLYEGHKISNPHLWIQTF